MLHPPRLPAERWPLTSSGGCVERGETLRGAGKRELLVRPLLRQSSGPLAEVFELHHSTSYHYVTSTNMTELRGGFARRRRCHRMPALSPWAICQVTRSTDGLALCRWPLLSGEN